MSKEPYRKEGRIRLFGMGGVEITIPKVIIDRAARSAGQTVEAFAKTHRVVHLFNDFTGYDAAYKFEEVKDEPQPAEKPKTEPKADAEFNKLREKLRR